MKKNLLILVVDDNLNFVDRMISLLEEIEQIGQISTATNYDEAHNKFVTESPDIVLLDINMPGKNGIELLKSIKKNNSVCEVIMLTNHADEYYRLQCLELGANNFLDKSNEFHRVPGIIKELVER